MSNLRSLEEEGIIPKSQITYCSKYDKECVKNNWGQYYLLISGSEASFIPQPFDGNYPSFDIIHLSELNLQECLSLKLDLDLSCCYTATLVPLSQILKSNTLQA